MKENRVSDADAASGGSGVGGGSMARTAAGAEIDGGCRSGGCAAAAVISPMIAMRTNSGSGRAVASGRTTRIAGWYLESAVHSPQSTGVHRGIMNANRVVSDLRELAART